MASIINLFYMETLDHANFSCLASFSTYHLMPREKISNLLLSSLCRRRESNLSRLCSKLVPYAIHYSITPWQSHRHLLSSFKVLLCLSRVSSKIIWPRAWTGFLGFQAPRLFDFELRPGSSLGFGSVEPRFPKAPKSKCCNLSKHATLRLS